MKVCIIGGTGLLGRQGAVLPPEMEIEYGNYLEMSDDEINNPVSRVGVLNPFVE